MTTVNALALALHIGAGSVALLAGLLAMVWRKGSRRHRGAGRAYFWSMSLVTVTALWLSAVKGDLFLGAIGVFSFYLIASGYRAVVRKHLHEQAQALDWALSGFAGVAGAVLVALGLAQSLRGQGLVAAVLGGAALALASADAWRLARGPREAMGWWYLHMTRMLAAYIATVTAVSVVNLQFLPETVRWLWPTVVGTIGITVWRAYYRRLFAARRRPRTGAASAA